MLQKIKQFLSLIIVAPIAGLFSKSPKAPKAERREDDFEYQPKTSIFKRFVDFMENHPVLRAALRIGGFSGWAFSIMKLGEVKLADLHIMTSAADMKTAFLWGQVATFLVITLILLFYDIERILAHKYLRWIPGLLLAEGSLALAITNVNTVIPFAAIAGISSAVGLCAAMTALLKAPLRKRLASVAWGLVIASAIYLLVCVFIPARVLTQSSSVLIGAAVLAFLSVILVHFDSYSGNKTHIINRFDGSATKDILRKMPYEYLFFIAICAAFTFAFNSANAVANVQRLEGFRYYEIIEMLTMVVSAVFIAFAVRPHSICALFIMATALGGAATILLNVNSFAAAETAMFAFFSYIGFACFKAGTLLYVITFAQNRPHPFFFAAVGSGAIAASELIAQLFTNKYPAALGSVNNYIIIFFVLLPVGYVLISRGLTHHGYTPEVMEQQEHGRSILKALSEGAKLSRRESEILEQLAVAGVSIEDLPDILLISESAIQGHLKRICQKAEIENTAELLAKFNV
ncbi:MAG: LuxR C-terminal-related transcriptional regulator [Oscillospiraceae bacterium]|nr:LuxR C-terminal-related transcriptional regulator [Oscillospiraceae bacterium]